MSENTYMRTVLLGFCIRSCDFFQVTHPIILKTPGRRWEQCYVISGSGFRTPPTVINKNNSLQDWDQTDRTKLLVYLLHIQSNIQICLMYDYKNNQLKMWFPFLFFFFNCYSEEHIMQKVLWYLQIVGTLKTICFLTKNIAKQSRESKVTRDDTDFHLL